MFIQTLTSSYCKFGACQKWEPAARMGDFENFLNVLVKSPLLPLAAYHIGADCSDWTVPTWNSLHENVLWCGQFYKLECKGSACYIVLNIGNECNLFCKIVKNCILSEVCMIKKQRLIVLFTSGVIYKRYKRPAYTPPALARFYEVNLSNTNNSAWLFILACLSGKGMQNINYNV